MMDVLSALPNLDITLDGQRADPALLEGLTRLWVAQSLGAATQCVLTLDEQAARAAEGVWMESALRVAIRGVSEPLFQGHITAIEHEYESGGGVAVFIRAYDALYAMQRERSISRRPNLNVEDLARELALPLGLEVHAHASGPVIQEQIQGGESHFDFLDRVAREAGLFLSLRGEELHLLTLEGDGDAISLSLGDTLFEARGEWNADAFTAGVVGYGWNTAVAQSHESFVASPRSGRKVAMTFGDTDSRFAETRTLANLHAEDLAQVEARAQSQLDLRAARSLVVRGSSEGNPTLQPGRPIELQGLADVFAGRHVVTRVTHSIDASDGFVSEFSTAPPRPRPRPAVSVPHASLAIVTRVDDPEDLGRVTVSLSAHGGVETHWIPVLCPAAGPGKGFVSLPDVDDRVLVLMPHGDLAQAVVIGSFYGDHGPPDSGVEGQRVRRYSWQTPGGQRIRLNDESGSLDLKAGRVAFRDGTGNRIEMNDEGITVHAEGDLTLAAPGRRVAIQASRVDFEER